MENIKVYKALFCLVIPVYLIDYGLDEPLVIARFKCINPFYHLLAKVALKIISLIEKIKPDYEPKYLFITTGELKDFNYKGHKGSINYDLKGRAE